MKKPNKKNTSKNWNDMSRSEKTIGVIGLTIIAVIIIVIGRAVIGGIGGSLETKNEQPKQEKIESKLKESKPTTSTDSQESKQVKEVSVLDKVNKVLDGFDDEMRTWLASTSVGGYQGSIIGVEADGDDGVIVKVSTNFSEPGYDDDGGQNIAFKIYSTICTDVPELNNLYATSTTSGLDSRSIYRSDIPACKN